MTTYWFEDLYARNARSTQVVIILELISNPLLHASADLTPDSPSSRNPLASLSSGSSSPAYHRTSYKGPQKPNTAGQSAYYVQTLLNDSRKYRPYSITLGSRAIALRFNHHRLLFLDASVPRAITLAFTFPHVGSIRRLLAIVESVELICRQAIAGA